MNFYNHHIGDYDEATSHLTACQDGIYSRMLRKYYATEKPLTLDIDKLQILVRARSDEERQAVLDVLEQFFHAGDDGWHQKTCDEVLQAFQDSEPERNLKRLNAENRLHRHREERAKLFKIVTDAGEHADWNIKIGQLRALAEQISAENEGKTGLSYKPETRGATYDATAHATAPATPATANHTRVPIPTTQYPVPKVKREETKGDVEVIARKQAKTPKPATLQADGKKAPRKRASLESSATRLDPEWLLPKSWGIWALEAFPHWTPEVVRKIAESFRDHWSALPPGRAALKTDWLATWRNWCKSGITQRDYPKPKAQVGRFGKAPPVDVAARNRELAAMFPDADFAEQGALQLETGDAHHG